MASRNYFKSLYTIFGMFTLVIILFMLYSRRYLYSSVSVVQRFKSPLPQCPTISSIKTTPEMQQTSTQQTNIVESEIPEDVKLHVQLTNDIDTGIIALRNITFQMMETINSQNLSQDLNNLTDSMKIRLRALEIANKGLKSIQEKKFQKLMENLSQKVQEAIKSSQNPTNCNGARKLVCHVKHLCGFGCMSHHIALCLSIAIGTKRTLMLKLDNFKYSRNEGWGSLFLPLSETCDVSSLNLTNIAEWEGKGELELTKNETVAKITINTAINPNSKFAANTLPRDLMEDVKKFHAYPALWYIGQIMKYILRSKSEISNQLSQKLNSTKIYPLVGIQVRRTDKLVKEAKLIALEKYMLYVKEWFDKYKMENIGINDDTKFVRSVYVATDDDTLLDEAKKMYPDYNFINDKSITAAASVKDRYSVDGLFGILTDVYILSHCDYVVCTFSSNVCRLVYELMQTLHIDATTRLHSLDKSYYFIGQWMHQHIAIYNYTKTADTKEISLKAGDHIGVDNRVEWGVTTWRGTNLRTWKTGIYPSYIAREYTNEAPYDLLG
ncbi:alpha-(1,6)-fucosyltransferase-like [Ciona intestinalis]